jgi:hypothetical protein
MKDYCKLCDSPLTDEEETKGSEICETCMGGEEDNVVGFIDLSLQNKALYEGCNIERLAGKLTLLSTPDETIEIMGQNLSKMNMDSDLVTISGGMAIWAYLIVFHFLHGKTKRIYYVDGKGTRILVGAHG